MAGAKMHKKGRGNPAWVKGVSGNPKGAPPGLKRRHRQVQDMLESRFTENGKVDELVEAIYSGVKRGSSTMITLAAHYRWGKPKEHITVDWVSELTPDEVKEAAEHILRMERQRGGHGEVDMTDVIEH